MPSEKQRFCNAGKELTDPRVLTDVGDVPVQEIRDCGVDDERLMKVVSESVKLVMEEVSYSGACFYLFILSFLYSFRLTCGLSLISDVSHPLYICNKKFNNSFKLVMERILFS